MTVHGGCSIDPTAWVHGYAHVEDARVGAGTKIWQFATVIRGTILGDDCNVGACATLSGPIFGNGCRISSGVTMGPGFIVGDRVFVGPNVVMCNDLFPSANLDGYDDTKLRSGEAFCVIVDDDVMIGANAVLLPGVHIGHGAVIGAGAVVSGKVQPEHIYHRNGRKTRLPENWRQMRMRYASEESMDG